MAAPRDAVGLDIGGSAVRAAHVGLSGSQPTLDAFGQVALPRGSVREGEISDVATVSQAISQLWKRAGIRKKKVVVGVASQKVVVRPVDLPYMSVDELKGALQFQVQEYIPMAAEDAVLDFQVFEEYVTENNERMMRILLVAAQKDMVNLVVEAVQRAGLDPIGVDVTPLALVRSVGARAGALGATAGVGEAIVDVGSDITNIVVHEGGVTRFVRILINGGGAISEALAASLGISYEEAEDMKVKTGLSASGADVPAETGARVLEDRARALVDEVRGTIDYYGAQAEATRIGKVIVTGGGSRLGNFAARLSDALRMPVEPARPLQNLKVGRVGLAAEELERAEALMSVPVGLALGMADE